MSAAGTLSRMRAILVKEFIQMRRDRLTFAMMTAIPIMQLILFGFAINTDPKHLPTTIIIAEESRPARSIVAALENSTYFHIISRSRTEAEAAKLLARGKVAFIVTIPANFERDLVRGDRPQLLIEADATDPAAASNALAAMPEILSQALSRDLKGSLGKLTRTPPPVDVILHRHYNPEGITQLNIVPGLLGIVLTMSMTMMTALSLTREIERGTMENLLAMPVRPVEVMIGKILPYIGVGTIQVIIILAAANLIFSVPLGGSLATLTLGIFLFIASMLMTGYTFSTLARTQMQAMQMTFFFFLPQLLLSGYLFPFRGMPGWAQVLGEVVPLTHFLRVIRGVLLKDNGLLDLGADLGAIALFLFFIAGLALLRYRRTLD